MIPHFPSVQRRERRILVPKTVVRIHEGKPWKEKRGVAEQADAPASGAGGAIRAGSTPAAPTNDPRPVGGRTCDGT